MLFLWCIPQIWSTKCFQFFSFCFFCHLSIQLFIARDLLLSSVSVLHHPFSLYNRNESYFLLVISKIILLQGKVVLQSFFVSIFLFNLFVWMFKWIFFVRLVVFREEKHQNWRLYILVNSKLPVYSFLLLRCCSN